MGKTVSLTEDMDKMVFLELHELVVDLDIWQDNQEDKEIRHMPKMKQLQNRSNLLVQPWKGM